MIAALLATLHIMTHNGAIYDVVEDIPAGSCIIGGTETLVYEASTFNTCQEIRLKPGCYRVEMMGGLGGLYPDCLNAAQQMITEPLSGMFTLNTETTVYAFRGGDGMPGTVNKSSSYYGSFGGGASGADSIVVVGDRVFRARGGVGGTCVRIIGNQSSLISKVVANGIGGGADFGDAAWSRPVCVSLYQYEKERYVNGFYGGGGGGAPSGTGGTTFARTDRCPTDAVVNVGASGTSLGGGNGGDVTNAYYNPDDTTPKNATGGRGGANVTWTCGGQTITVYGGGGGGACINGSYAISINGGDGGSGSTGTSNTSYLRIYKM